MIESNCLKHTQLAFEECKLEGKRKLVISRVGFLKKKTKNLAH
jgi:hypothetical protein